mgnify:CR=1 FL=1
MHNVVNELNNLRRPKLLIRAARAGMAEYRKSGKPGALPQCQSTQKTVDVLLQKEALLNGERLEQNAAYSVRKHIQILSALMVEVGEVSQLSCAS